MARFCPNCGTEVDDTAVFCPTCGQPIEQDVEGQMPAAPAWPDPEPGPRAVEPAAAAIEPPRPSPDADEEPAPPPSRVEPTRVEARPEFPRPPQEPRHEEPARAASADPARPMVDLPITTPVTLSAWLIGIGALLGAVGALIGLFDSVGAAIDLLVLVALLGVAATVFLASSLPAIPHLRFLTLAVVLVAFGVALDRLGVGRAGPGDLLLFLGSAAAVIGAVLLDLGHDQPLSGSQS